MGIKHPYMMMDQRTREQRVDTAPSLQFSFRLQDPRANAPESREIIAHYPHQSELR